MSIYFYKPFHNDGYLNNLYPSSFTVEGKNFINVEQYFVWRKVMLFDPEFEEYSDNSILQIQQSFLWTLTEQFVPSRIE